MPTYTIIADVTVAGIGKKTTTVTGVVGSNIQDAITKANIVQTVVTSVTQTAP